MRWDSRLCVCAILLFSSLVSYADEFPRRFAIESASEEILPQIALIGDGLSSVHSVSFINWGSVQTNAPVNGVNTYEPFPSNSWWAAFLDELDAADRGLLCTLELGATPWAVERDTNIMVQNPKTGLPMPGLVRIHPEYIDAWKDFVKHLLEMTPQITHLQIESEAENVWVNASGYVEVLRHAYDAVQEFNAANPGRDIQVAAAGFNLAGILLILENEQYQQDLEALIDEIVEAYPDPVAGEVIEAMFPGMNENTLLEFSRRLHIVIGVLSQEDPNDPSFDILALHHDRTRTYDTAGTLTAWYRDQMANGVHGAYDRPIWVDDMSSNYHPGDGFGISQEDQQLLDLLDAGDEETIAAYNAQQPIWLVRKAVGHFAGGFDRVSIAYGHDLPNYFMPIWRYMGLFYTNHMPKPSYYTTRIMVEKLDGFTNVAQIAQANTNDYVFQFTFAAKPDVFVAWREDGSGAIDLSAHAAGDSLLVTHLVMETTAEGDAIWPDDGLMVPTDDVPVGPEPVFLEAGQVLTVTGAVVTSRPYDGTTFAEITGAVLSGTNGTEGLVLANATTGTFAQAGVGTNIPVTTFMTLEGDGSENYTLIQPTLTGDITLAELTVTGAVVTSRPYDGTTLAEITGAALSGANEMEGITLANAATGTFTQSSVGTNITVTTSMTLEGEGAENYLLTQPALTGDIARKELTVNVTKKYDGNAEIDSAQCSLVGVVEEEDVFLDILEGTYDSGPEPMIGGSVTVTDGPTLGGTADLGNYTVATPTTGDITLAVPVAEVWVDTNFTDQTSGWMLTNFPTIQSAINGVAASGTVYVADGLYREDLSIPGSKDGVTLIAMGGDATIKGIETRPLPPSENPPAFNIEILAHDVTIQGFAIESPDIPINHYAAGLLEGAPGAQILHNEFLAVGSENSLAVVVFTLGKDVEPDIDISGLMVVSNVFSSSGALSYVGVLVNEDAAEELIRIEDNAFSGNIETGIQLERSKAIISGNLLSGNVSGIGIAILQGYGNDQGDIDVFGNTMANFDHGLVLGQSTGSQKLVDVRAGENVVEGNTVGILTRLASDSDVEIVNNELVNNAAQVWHSAGAGGLDFETILASNLFDRAVVVRGSAVKVPIIFSSIQAAIDHATLEEIIDVMPGIYPERIEVNKRLTLVGDPDDPEQVIIDGGGEGNVVLILPTADETELSGFTVQNSGMDLENPRAGIVLAGVSDVSVMGNIVRSNMNGIALTALPNFEANDNVILSNTISGNLAITTDPEFAVEQSSGVLIDRLPNSTRTNSGNRIENNQISGSRVGIYLTEAASDTVVHLNQVFENIHHGIELNKSDGNTFTENEIYNNGVIGQGLDPMYDDSPAALNAVGVWIGGARGNSFISNEVYNVEASGGLQVKGFRLFDTDGRNPTDNNLNANRIYGHMEGDSPNLGGVKNFGYESATPEAVNAVSNWWGHPTGPANAVLNPSGEGDAVTTNVMFYPWYIDETMTMLSEQVAITAGPQSLTNTAFELASFTVSASGTGPLHYQWQKDGLNIEGETNATYEVDAVVVGDAGDYRCVVSNLFSAVTSVVATLTVEAVPLTVTGATVAPKPYDGTTFAEITGAVLSGTNGTEGLTLTNASTGTFAQADVGTNILVTTAMTLSGSGVENYVLIQPELTGDILPKELTVTADDISKGYLLTYTFFGTEFKVNGLIGSDAVTNVTLTSDGTAAQAEPGEYSILASAAQGSGLSNYAIDYVDGTLTVVLPMIEELVAIPDGSGDYSFEIPDGYALVDVEGADLSVMSDGGFNWTILVEGVDYEMEGDSVRILVEGKGGLVVRIRLGAATP